VARWYDPVTGHFTSADSIIPEPGKASAFDRYGYSNNNPLKYSDPSGHFPIDELLDAAFIAFDTVAIATDLNSIGSYGLTQGNQTLLNQDSLALAADVLCVLIPYLTGGGPGSRVIIAGGDVSQVVSKAEVIVARIPQTLRSGQMILKGAQTVTRSLMKSDNNSSDSSSSSSPDPLDSLPNNSQEMYEKYEKNGWQGNLPGQTPGTEAGGAYNNHDGKLPTIDSFGNPITYKEFDINNKVLGQPRDAERFVRGNNGSVWYTKNHYKSFKKLK
jgi:guanyl-specific ribonuclease Sa